MRSSTDSQSSGVCQTYGVTSRVRRTLSYAVAPHRNASRRDTRYRTATRCARRSTPQHASSEPKATILTFLRSHPPHHPGDSNDETTLVSNSEMTPEQLAAYEAASATYEAAMAASSAASSAAYEAAMAAVGLGVQVGA